MTIFHTVFAVIAFALLFAFAKADLPVHCLPDETSGVWTLYKSAAGKSSTDIRKQCGFHSTFDIASTVKVKLEQPNIAVDVNTGALGKWTNIYDQGFEVTIGGVVYFAFFSYEKSGSKVISHCDKTFVGAFHDEGVTQGSSASNWGCYYAAQESNSNGVNTKVEYTEDEHLTYSMSRKVLKNDAAYINALNEAQSSWIAGPSPFEGMSMDEIFRISGSTNKVNKFKMDRTRKYFAKTRAARAVASHYTATADPTNLDWRNVSGENFVTPVRNQGSCGSCWIFGVVSSLQDRIMVSSKGQKSYNLSPQHIADCSMENPEYGQSCEGGFPYLASKWVHDFGGLTHEKCYPYSARDQSCKSHSCDLPTVYVGKYSYVGGYYGGANEKDMIRDVVDNGPSVVGIMVYNDFFHYRGGIYHHTKTPLDAAHVGRWEEINHAVELVGYGIQESTGEKYWIIKNSWGASWGLQGYALIRRGTDEIGIESCVVSAIPYTL